jgi:hypothetical protein
MDCENEPLMSATVWKHIRPTHLESTLDETEFPSLGTTPFHGEKTANTSTTPTNKEPATRKPPAEAVDTPAAMETETKATGAVDTSPATETETKPTDGGTRPSQTNPSTFKPAETGTAPPESPDPSTVPKETDTTEPHTRETHTTQEPQSNTSATSTAMDAENAETTKGTEKPGATAPSSVNTSKGAENADSDSDTSTIKEDDQTSEYDQNELYTPPTRAKRNRKNSPKQSHKKARKGIKVAMGKTRMFPV